MASTNGSLKSLPSSNVYDFYLNGAFDDVMVSYAVTEGGVGPHFDRYDVFLVQGSGRRKWRLGEWCDDDTPRNRATMTLTCCKILKRQKNMSWKPVMCFMYRQAWPIGGSLRHPA